MTDKEIEKNRLRIIKECNLIDSNNLITKEKQQRRILIDILHLKTSGLKVIQENFNFTILKNQWWRIDPKGLFKIKTIKNNKLWRVNVNKKELGCLASELNAWA